jgi:hypothetical protein
MSNEIENIFKQKFENFESAPSAGLFDKIQAARAKKKRIVIWMWSSAALLLFSLGLGYTVLSTSSDIKLAEDKTIEKEQKTKLSTSEEQIFPAIEHDKFLSSGNESIDSREEVQSSKTKSQTTGGANSFVAQKEIKRTLSIDRTVLPQAKKRTVNEELAKLYQKIHNANKNADPKKAKIFTRNGESEVDLSAINLANLTKRNIPEIKTPITNIDSANAFQIDRPQDGDKADKNLPIGKLVKLSRWSIEASAAGGLGSRILSGPSDYVAMRNTTESVKFSTAYNLNVLYRINTKWSAQTGVSLINRRENLSYTSADQMTYMQREETRTEIIIHPVLGEIEREYTVTVTDSSVQKRNQTNQTDTYLSASIPLVFERGLYEGEKWSLMNKIGILAGIYSHANGQIVTGERQSEDLQAIPTKSTGFHSFTYGIGAAYKCTDRISLIVYPQAFIGLNSALKTSAGISQKELGFYTHFGLRIQL